MLPSVVRLFAECAPGQRIKVTAGGRTYELPEKPPEPTPAPPDPVVELAKVLRAADERNQREQEAIKGLLEQTVKSQADIVETLMLPVVPTGYDKSGRIMSAQRKRN